MPKSIPSAGDLNEQIQLLAPTVTPDTTGEPLTAHRAIATVWASAEELTGRELENARRRVNEVTVRFVIRYRKVSETWKVVWRGQIFDVKAKTSLTPRKEWLELLCTEVR